jgi:tetratricopeptide (TPR) repeat protein
MDCRKSLLLALSLTITSGCVTTQPTVPNQANVPDTRSQPALSKSSESGKRPPLPGTVVSLAVIKEREAENEKTTDAAQKIKLYDEARQYYQEALRIDPKYREAIQGLARVYSHVDDFPHALSIYKGALDKNPKDHGMWFDLGMCYSRQKDLAQALQCYQKALDLDPENLTYMKQLGFTLARMGQTEQGLAYLTRALGAALAHYNLARMMDHLGQSDQCRRHLEMALQINPNLPQARDMLVAMNSPNPQRSAQ